MKIETLKKLVAKTCDEVVQDNYGLATDAVVKIREEIFQLIDLYEEDNKSNLNYVFGRTSVSNGVEMVATDTTKGGEQ